jgi:hypothetical protein
MEPALNRVLDFGFDDLNLHRIQAVVPYGVLKYLKRQECERTRKATTTLEIGLV